MSNSNDLEAPTSGVTDLGTHDVICGRGGAALRHPGNLAYRKLVNLNKGLYATCLKTEKLRISKSIVAAIREVKGRFLEREDGKISATLDEKDDSGDPVKWSDIGDRRAIEKTSQALREGQPKLLKKLAELQDGGVDTHAATQVPSNNDLHSAPMSYVGTSQYGLMNQAHPSISGQHAMMPPPQSVPNHNQIHNMHSTQNYEIHGLEPNQINSGTYGQTPRNHVLQREGSFGLEGLESFSTFPRNSFVTNGHNSQTAPYHDSWAADPAPLPYSGGADITEQIFSPENQQHLLAVLADDKSTASSVNRPSIAPFTIASMQSDDAKNQPKRRSSVQFKVKDRPSLSQVKRMSIGFGDSVRSLTSHLSEMSVMETHSLDSAMDAFERESELSLLGEFEDGNWENYDETLEHENRAGYEYYQNKRESPGAMAAVGKTPVSGPNETSKNRRRSNLRGSLRWSQNSFPSATVNEGYDPGMIFTSTFDAKPGGINSGTDISGLLTERRKSQKAFDSNAGRMRASLRMSMGSTCASFRDNGSSIFSDIRELIDLDDELDEVKSVRR